MSTLHIVNRNVRYINKLNKERRDKRHDRQERSHNNQLSSTNIKEEEYDIEDYIEQEDFWHIRDLSEEELENRHLGIYFSSYDLTDRQQMGADLTITQLRQLCDYNRLHDVPINLQKYLIADQIYRERGKFASVSEFGSLDKYEPNYFIIEFINQLKLELNE